MDIWRPTVVVRIFEMFGQTLGGSGISQLLLLPSDVSSVSFARSKNAIEGLQAKIGDRAFDAKTPIQQFDNQPQRNEFNPR